MHLLIRECSTGLWAKLVVGLTECIGHAIILVTQKLTPPENQGFEKFCGRASTCTSNSPWWEPLVG